jgi:hypothetical protein
MANNLSITTGTGGLVATDEVVIGGVAVHVQRVKIHDGSEDSANAWVIAADGSGLVQVAGLKGPGATNALSLATGAWVEAKVGGSVLVNRKSLLLQNRSDVDINWSFDNTRTLAQTHIIPSGQSATLDIGTTPVYVQASAGSAKSLIVSEMS